MNEAVVQRVAGQAAAWIYEKPRQKGKMHLLTIGCISVTGDWKGELGEFFLAWSPLLKRDKQKEAEIIAARKSQFLDSSPRKLPPVVMLAPHCAHGDTICSYHCTGQERGHCKGFDHA